MHKEIYDGIIDYKKKNRTMKQKTEIKQEKVEWKRPN